MTAPSLSVDYGIPQRQRLGLTGLVTWAFSWAREDRQTRGRLCLMAVGVAVGVFVLLALATVNPVMTATTERRAAAVPDDQQGQQTFLAVTAYNSVGGNGVYGTLLSPGSMVAPPAPPGTEHFPAAGELVVSPALAEMLEQPDQRALRAMLPGRVVGLIDPEVLPGRLDLVYYQGVDDPSFDSGAYPAQGWGNPGWLQIQPSGAFFTAGSLILLIPLMTFIGLASRVGEASRERRTSLLRLLGASALHARLAVAAEALTSAVAGVVLGVFAYLAAHLAAASLPIPGLSYQPADLWPARVPALLTVLGVPLFAVAAAVITMRTSPGSSPSRRSRSGRQALWLPVGLLVVACAVTVFVLVHSDDNGFGSMDTDSVLSAVAVAGAYISAVAVLVRPASIWMSRIPWAGAVAEFTRGQLGRETTSTRAAASLAAGLTGVIALTSLLASVPGDDEVRTYSGQAIGLTIDQMDRLDRSLAGVPGVEFADLDSDLPLEAPGATVSLRNCGSLDRVLGFGAAGKVEPCRNGKVYGWAESWRPTQPPVFDVPGTSISWSPPTDTQIELVKDLYQDQVDAYALTPAAARVQIPGVTELGLTRIEIHMPPSSYDDLREATSWMGWQSATLVTYSDARSAIDDPFRVARLALTAAAVLALAICVLGQWLISVGQVRERRRVYALARAGGVPVAVLRLAVILTAMVPVTVGVIMAVVGGGVFAWVFQHIRDAPDISWSWTAVAGAGLIALAASALIALGVAARLSRITGPSAMRTE